MIESLHLLFLSIALGSALVCLNCPDITHPRFCEHVERCSTNDTCGMEQNVDDFGDVTYSLGCMSSQKCSDPIDNDTVTCHTCCSSDLCNSEGCGEIDTNSKVNVCYHCTGTLDNEECHRIAFCKDEELCFIKEEYRNTEKYFQTGCMAKNMCNSNIQSIFGKRADPVNRCCSGNLCNTKSESVTAVLPGFITTTLPQINVVPNGNCSSSAARVKSVINCDFDDKDICGYQQDIHDKLDWSWHSGRTSSLNTGPSADHTSSSGYYMYLETSLALRKGDNARLWSPTFTSSDGQCLSFWYNMYGVGIGTLTVYMEDNSTLSQPAWSLSGNRNNTWHEGVIPLKTSQNVRIMFEALAGDGYTGDVAIDDVNIMDACPCVQTIPDTPTTTTMATAVLGSSAFVTTDSASPSSLPPIVTSLPTLQSTSTTATPAPVSTPATVISSPVNCDFENETICGYKQESNETHDWIRHSGRTNSLNTGPNADHTFNAQNGHYMYLETSNALHSGEKARLWTPSFTPNKGQCLSFWYHMNGVTVGSLNIYSGHNTTGIEQLGDNLTTITGNQGQSWHKKCVSFKASSATNIVFEAVTGDGYTGDIAIDDVQLNEPCPCAV